MEEMDEEDENDGEDDEDADDGSDGSSDGSDDEGGSKKGPPKKKAKLNPKKSFAEEIPEEAGYIHHMF